MNFPKACLISLIQDRIEKDDRSGTECTFRFMAVLGQAGPVF